MRMLLSSSVVALLVIPVSRLNAQDDSAIPPAVVESWSHLIGDWNVNGRIGSTPVQGSARFEWADGKHCYFGQQTWRIGEEGRNVHLALIGGWDAAENETVEQGFDSSGTAATVRYRSPDDKANGIEGSIDGVSGPNARWSGAVKLEYNEPNEFQLSTTIDGEVVHSLKYVRAEDAR